MRHLQSCSNDTEHSNVVQVNLILLKGCTAAIDRSDSNTVSLPSADPHKVQ